MAQTVATALLMILGGYALIGLCFGVAFVTVGVGRVDPAARSAPWGFRLLILPGAALFWPLLAWRWFGGHPVPVERTAHRDAARSRS